ncbi:hypothetical protein [Methylocella sp.]|uniref:hypothetical protein n=1 Tax=Methylocella sp. TaxID=1978226 RepID=UPI003784C1DD
MAFAVSSVPLYGLLHVASDHGAHANLRAGAADPIDVYLKCAALCAASVEAAGSTFTLVTNDMARLETRRAALGLGGPRIVARDFVWPVPRGIAFYSAHYKLELIEAFGAGAYGERVGLIDVDALLTRPFALPSLTDEALAVYDITAIESASYGAARVRADLETVAGRPLTDPRWYGGEFILGAAGAFMALFEHVRACWARYEAAIGGLHHVGDEMIVSAALNLARADGMKLLNADQPGGVARWWTARTDAPIPPFSAIADRSLLHLPADKEFLAAYPAAGFDGARFLSGFRAYAARKLFARRLVNVGAALLGRGRKHVARLS